MKNIINIKTIVAELDVHKKYEVKSHIITLKVENIIQKINTFFKLLDTIFAILAGIIKNAQISIIQNIFILSAIKIDNIIKKHKLYKSTFIHLDLAISSFIIILRKFLEKKYNNI